jgi:hypothetical protein
VEAWASLLYQSFPFETKRKRRLVAYLIEYTFHNVVMSVLIKEGQTGPAFVEQESELAVRRRITDHLAVYMAELMTVLQWAEEVKPDSVVICSDSCAALMSLQSFSSHSRQGALHEGIQIHAQVRQIQWGEQGFDTLPILQVFLLKKHVEVCNLYHRYTSTVRDGI